ncbi:hypothetical protein PFICI_00140 [Pestalotiopsis fici W106-1]|uniref:NACHT domain-containing protein n=1 Tax=Pestalotiopsis fici (strain W106-1 / CGMCC3.15140) TaxID=1229662 RepID=W3XLI0_PESFW|nr:uncharacterized protein PFICI_00140 [Pestalotiopsis fici W106-1]ETS86312.1 hypothetical protein PFICI_00140 [Pestalotiopsis fici W106-1]
MPSKFGPAASASARETIRTAFEELDRTITPVDSRDFHSTTLEDVRSAALEIETQLAVKQSLRNLRRLMPLFQGLEHYAKVVDVLCNGTPYLAWIWAPITLILRLASEYVEAFEAIMKGYSKIAESLVRFEILQKAFTGNQQFQQTLAVFYSDILQFHKFAYTFLRRSSWKLMFLTSWGRFERRFHGILEDLDRHGALIDQEANARNIFESRQQWQEIQAWREENYERLKRQENEQAAKQYGYIKSWLKADDSEQLTIQDLASFEGNQYPGTCTWALDNQTLRAWLRKDTNSCLCWLQGIPGAGKTILLTQIQAFMRADSRIVLSHFLSSSYASSASYDQILRSLLLQLLQQDEDLTAHVYARYVMEKKIASTSALEQLVKVLFTTTSQEPRSTQFIWVLIDSFEACESNKQASLISLMNQLVSKNPRSGGTVCKFLIASRASPLLSKRLRNDQIISMTKEKQALDVAIRVYTSHRLDRLRDRFDQLHLGHNNLEDIQSAIAKKLMVSGMFLYARLILDYIGRKIFYSADEVRRSVDDLPRELADYYREILAQIIAPLDKQSNERVRSLFGWIAFARNPLKRLELLSAITFSSSDHLVPHLVPDFILTVCGALVEERPNATLAFIHSTVKEFLQSTTSNLPLDDTISIHEHGVASVTCLRAGLHVFRSDASRHAQNLRVVHGLHGFHLYANNYWVDYLLEIMKISSKPINEVPLYQLAVDLAAQANQNEIQSVFDNEGERSSGDEGLSLIPDVQLRRLVRLTLKSRSHKTTEQQIFVVDDIDETLKRRDEMITQTSLQAITSSYQDIVVFLLEQRDYPEISSEELQRFKNQFRNSGFTCRFDKCHFATIGFDSYAERNEHELTHSKPFTCPITDCKYPAFVSKAAVQRHVNKIHVVTIQRKPLRRPGSVKPTTKLNSSTMKIGPISNRHTPRPMAEISHDDPIRDLSAPSVPDQSAEKHRVQVYEFRYNQWQDRGIGFCTADYQIESDLDDAVVTVESEDPPYGILLELHLPAPTIFHKQQGKLIRWYDPREGVDMSLGFQEVEGCTMVWRCIEQVQGLEDAVDEDATFKSLVAFVHSEEGSEDEIIEEALEDV